MVLTADQKRGWLRSLIETARVAGTPLNTYLLGLLVSKGSAVTDAEYVSSVSANGKSIGFSIPGSSGPIPPEVLGLVSVFLDLYDEALAGLIEGGNATPTDAQIGSAMVAAIHGVVSFQTNHSRIREFA